MEKREPSCLEQPLWKMAGRFLDILGTELVYDPATPLLGTHPKRAKTLTWKDICTHKFTAELFTITNIWEHHLSLY